MYTMGKCLKPKTPSEKKKGGRGSPHSTVSECASTQYIDESNIAVGSQFLNEREGKAISSQAVLSFEIPIFNSVQLL